MRMSSAVFTVLVVGCSASTAEPDVAVGNGSTSEVGVGIDLGMDAESATVSDYTYYEHVQPIIAGRCTTCHREGGIGPFTLSSYEEVYALKDLVAEVVEHRTMPPFLPTPGCREYTFDPSLSHAQMDVIRDWTDRGAPAGDPNLSPEPQLPSFPAVPQFDTSLEMPEGYTPQIRPDDYRCFVLDWPSTETRYITGFGAEPGDERVVHHIVAYHATPELADAAIALDAAEDGPGYTCFGGPLLGDGIAGQTPWLGAWAPGGNGSKYPAGTGLPIEPGSKVVVQVHYNTLAVDPVPDRTKVRFETADTVAKPAFFHLWASPTWLEGIGMPIPAGNPAVSHRFSLDPTLITDGRPLTLTARTSTCICLVARRRRT